MEATLQIVTIEEHETAPIAGIVLGGDATHVVIAVPKVPETREKGNKENQ